MKENDIVILVVDDERNHADGLVEALEGYCSQAIAVYTGKDALEIIHKQQIDIVITDLKLEGEIDGLAILQEAKNYNPAIAVVLITAYGTIGTCKEAIKMGAFDYLLKPIDIDQLRTIVNQAARKTNRAGAANNNDNNSSEFFFDGVRGKNSSVNKIFQILRRVSPTNISVLIEGPSGTGKELLAKAVHENSHRKDKPFRPINCAGLTESLLESELFGHAKGAFTGAITDHKGLFEIADKGTLFLDEIGDMPLNMQAKLLRVLEGGVVTPVGSNKSVVVDVRIISATNHNLAKLVDEKKFRQDLYYRIKGVSISLPSLSERAGDIPEFIEYFIKEAASETGSAVKGITESAVNILTGYQWPGNIRQLRNVIKTMVVMCDRNKLDIQDIPSEINKVRQLTAGADDSQINMSSVSLDHLEKKAIIETLAKTNGSREKAAKLLGIGERTLYRKIKEYNL